MIGSGWIAITLVVLLLLTLRYWDWISKWRVNWGDMHKPLLYRITYIPRKELKLHLDWMDAWSRGKQVTFMEPAYHSKTTGLPYEGPSPFIKVDSRSIHDSLAMFPEEEYRRALDSRHYGS